MLDLNFYRDKKVFITGHTGFKGAWLCQILSIFGAKIRGYALSPETEPNLFSILKIDQLVDSVFGDIRDLSCLRESLFNFQPEIVFHLAAQPIVRASYNNPVYTYETNVMGTVNILEAVRHCPSVRSLVVVTTDKVYKNLEWEWGYRESDILDGFDPYSNSKSCAELVTSSYKKSFFTHQKVAISTARAGNVIGGGDFAQDRIIPDCIRASALRQEIVVRNPYSTRPYQHVLEPLSAYLLLAQRQYDDVHLSDCYNIGPEDQDCVTTGVLADCFCRYWGEPAKWKNISIEGPHEANFLKLDCSKAKAKLGWKPQWNVDIAIQKTVEWSKCYLDGAKIVECTRRQIDDFFAGC
jgi:CDP-glucose 4,6-dehydratase